MYKQYIRDDVEGFYFGPYTSLNLFMNQVSLSETYPLLGGGISIGTSYSYKRLSIETGVGLGVGLPLRDGLFLTGTSSDTPIGPLVNSGVSLINTIITFSPSFIHLNIGYKYKHKPVMKHF